MATSNPSSIVIGAIIGFIFSILANLITGPIIAWLTDFRVLKFFAILKFLRNRDYDGDWNVTWEDNSKDPSQSFSNRVRIYSFLNAVGFEANFQIDHVTVKYNFIGFQNNNAYSGRWYDPRSAGGYHGQFQVVWNGILTMLAGKWLGWSTHDGVKAGTITISRIQDDMH